MRSVVIGATIRDVSRTIVGEVRRALKAFEAFDVRGIVLIESDSSDGTLLALHQLKRELPHLRLISLGTLSNFHPKRTDRLALSKNRLLNEIECDAHLRSADYIFITDPDEESPYLNSASIESCWRRSDWSVVTANQIGPYYDIWTLRHPSWCPLDCWHEVAELVKAGVPRDAAISRIILRRMVRIPTESPWIEVESAFGGSALYRREVLIGRRYWGLRNDGTELSDHISVHQQIRADGGKIFINPRMTNRGYCEHSLQLSPNVVVEDLSSFLARSGPGRQCDW